VIRSSPNRVDGGARARRTRANLKILPARCLHAANPGKGSTNFPGPHGWGKERIRGQVFVSLLESELQEGQGLGEETGGPRPDMKGRRRRGTTRELQITENRRKHCKKTSKEQGLTRTHSTELGGEDRKEDERRREV